jgi:hypothetical protein
MYNIVNHHYIVVDHVEGTSMASRQDLGRLIASQAVAVAAGAAELRLLTARVEQVWASPDGDRLRSDVVDRAAALDRAAADLLAFGKGIEAEAIAAAAQAAAEPENDALSAGSGAGGGTGRGGVEP